MKIYDISQEVFGSAVYPGDPSPERKVISSMERGDLYRLTAFSMCAHNGTHIDAPAHFIRNGKTVEQLVRDGINAKVTSIGEESQVKLQETMQKIVNESNGGMVCIII